MIWVIFDSICLGFEVGVWIGECDGEHIVLGVDAPKIAESEWPFQCWDGYGSPQVDYLETTFQESRRFIWRKVTTDARNRVRKSLVNVNMVGRLSLFGLVSLIRLMATND